MGATEAAMATPLFGPLSKKYGNISSLDMYACTSDSSIYVNIVVVSGVLVLT